MITAEAFFGGARRVATNEREIVVKLTTRETILSLTSGSGSATVTIGNDFTVTDWPKIHSTGGFVYIVRNDPESSDQATLRWQVDASYTTLTLNPGQWAVINRGNPKLYHELTGRSSPGGPAVVDVDGLSCGGGGAPGSTAVRRLDTPTDTWAGDTSMTYEKTDAAGWEQGRDAYVTGSGLISAGCANHEKLERYRVGTWSALTDHPGPGLQSVLQYDIERAAAASYRKDGYVFSGSLAQGDEDVYRYTKATDTWVKLTDLPMRRDRFTASTFADRIYILSGFPELSPSWAFHAPTSTFDLLESYTGVSRHSLASFTQGNRIIAAGGYRESTLEARDDVDSYDPSSRTWAASSALPSPRYNGGAFTSLGSGYYFGGLDEVAAAQTTTWRRSGTSWAVVGATPATFGNTNTSFGTVE